MKKIININLSGRVIPIEDSAFESLQRYIESLRRYFANEEGRDEIINDIESRIAELMNEKIKKGSTAVADADIDQIIASMGRIEDFEQTDAAESIGEKPSGTSGSYSNQAPPPRAKGRLYRDPSDKILGGVCSGVANYLSVDPAIIRLIFALLVFGAGTGVLIYILLWIILPVKPVVVEAASRTPGKRFFRNPDDRVIGGVAGGLAAYFNKEAWIFRLVFAAPLILNILFGVLNGVFFAFHRDVFPNFFIGSFTGTFLIAYVVLWIILPEAKTPYEKMEMRGETVDVNTIRQNVQEGMSDFKGRMQNWSDEVKTTAQNLGDKAKTFAGRGKQFASEVHQTTRPIRSGLGHAIGVIIKAFFLFIAGSIAFSLFIGLIVILFGGSVAIGGKQHLLNFFLDGFWQHAFFWGTVVFFFLVPVIAFVTWLVRRIMKIKSQRHYLGYVFGGLWFVGIICVGSLITSLVTDFRRGTIKSDVVQIAQPPNGKMIVTVNEPEISYSGDIWFINTDAGWDLTEDTMKLSNIRVRVAKSEDSSYSVTIQRFGRGSTTAEARDRAGKIGYTINSKDSFLYLGSGFSIDRESKFRGQRVVVEIKVPVGKKINFNESVVETLNTIRIKDRFRNKRFRRDMDFEWNDDDYFEWKTGVDYVMTADGRLKEVNAPANTTTEPNNNQPDTSKPKKPKNSTTFYQEREKEKEIPISIPIMPIILVEGFS